MVCPPRSLSDELAAGFAGPPLRTPGGRHGSSRGRSLPDAALGAFVPSCRAATGLYPRILCSVLASAAAIKQSGMKDDVELLREYAQARSEDAFAELVRR